MDISEGDRLSYTEDGKPALVIVIENNNSLGGGLIEVGFNLYRTEVINVLAEIFNIAPTDMDSLSLTQIVDKFGEDWQINEIRNIAAKKYNKIISLTDNDATGFALLDTLKYLSKENYNIDLIVNLHGGGQSIWFSDNSYDIIHFTSKLKANNIHIRSLYQTCCFGSEMIDDWEAIDIISVNGSSKFNSLAMFSPIFFIDNWTNGSTYQNAVHNAYQMEIEKIQSYRTILPVMEYLITDDIKVESKQFVGGLNINLLWGDYPVII
ncbi:hypothetical protein HQ585_17470 [candidate division KSB1 bacterium]|nr:hypothetical protein [candidate division KSB1 bacterium]